MHHERRAGVLGKLSPFFNQPKQRGVAQVCAGMCVRWRERRLVSAVCSHGRDAGEERRARPVIDGPHSELRVWAEENHRVFFSLPRT